MKLSVWVICLAMAATCAARNRNDYEKGTLVRMESSSCGMQEKGSKTLAGEILGTDGQHRKTQEVLCQEYVLQSATVTYRIRPKDDKHPVLLPIGETTQFRIHKDKLVLKVPELDDKEREYIVVSMVPRKETNQSAEVAAK